MTLSSIGRSPRVRSIFARVPERYGEFNVSLFLEASKKWGSKFWAALPFCGEYQTYENSCRELEQMIKNPQTSLGELRDKINAIAKSVDQPTKMSEDGTLISDLRPMLRWRNTIMHLVVEYGVDAKLHGFMSQALLSSLQDVAGVAVQMEGLGVESQDPPISASPVIKS